MTNPATNLYGTIDIEFDYIPVNGITILLTTDILGISQFHEQAYGYNPVSLQLGTKTVSGIVYAVGTTLVNGIAVDQQDFAIASSFNFQKTHVRFYINKQNLSIYFGGKWVYSYSLAYVNYVNDPINASLSVHGGALQLYKIVRIELDDYRDAIFFDYESTADNCIQSIIQERPIQIYPDPGRILTFTYGVVRGDLDTHYVKEYRSSIASSNGLSSDGLIYYVNVSVNTSADTAKEVGLVTKLYRLSNLNDGAVKATQILQRLALERRFPTYIKERFDPRVVIGDRVAVDMIISGTLTHIEDRSIVENASIMLSDGQYTFEMNGRRSL